MRLIKAKVSGYKRLAHDCELNLDTDPVCIVGPNAAGKSSFLDALSHLNDGRGFADGERTRVPGGGRLEPSIEVRFELEADDRARLEAIPEASAVSQFMVLKDEEDGLHYLADPFPERDLGKREATFKTLEMLRELGWPFQAQEIEQALEAPPDPPIGPLFEQTLERAEGDDEWIEDQALTFRRLGNRMNQILAQVAEREKAAKEKEEYEGPDWPALPESLGDFPAELIALTGWETTTTQWTRWRHN
jgi:AAA domain, putative AbiEii toxin, Type IV TA system